MPYIGMPTEYENFLQQSNMDVDNEQRNPVSAEWIGEDTDDEASQMTDIEEDNINQQSARARNRSFGSVSGISDFSLTDTEDEGEDGGGDDLEDMDEDVLEEETPASGGQQSEFAEVLFDIDFVLQPGSLVAVVGSVSSGKSSLLSAAWGEALLTGGGASSATHLAVVPQRPFTVAGTIRDNIVMGRHDDDARVDEVHSHTFHFASALCP